MELSTSTNICAFTATRERMPVEFCIERCAEAGYRVLDMNFCIAMNPVSPMRDDHWQDYIASISALAKRLGIRFSQSHLPYYDVDRIKDLPQAEIMEELIRRSIIGSRMLGVRWAVTHPFTVYSDAENEQANLDANLAYYTKHLKTARENGVGIALETDYDLPHQRIYCGRIDELARLCDAFNDPGYIGICYDFGHANLQSGNETHRQKLNRIGARLTAVHVQDNHGRADEHLLPFFGSIDWQNAMQGLHDIGYDNDFTFEVQEFGRCLPPDMKHLTVALSVEVGKRLISMVHG